MMLPLLGSNVTFFEEEKTLTKTRRSGRDMTGGGHLAEAPKGQAWLHPVISLTGPRKIFQASFFTWYIEMLNCRHAGHFTDR
jgi:hypothetical protein